MFAKGVHVRTPTMVILEHIFSNILQNVVGHNTKNSIDKKFLFFNLYCVISTLSQNMANMITPMIGFVVINVIHDYVTM